MNIEDYRNYCLKKPATAESFPFGEETLVFKVMGKMFALTQIDTFESIALKCEPEKALSLKETYSQILPAYHMNKKHWIMILTQEGLTDEFIYNLIDHSYELVINTLPKKIQKEFHAK